MALDGFEAEELIAEGSAILRQRTPYQPLPKLTFPSEVSSLGPFLRAVLGRSFKTSLIAFPPQAAALEAVLLLSRVKDGDFSARVGPVPIDFRQLVSAKRYTTGPISMAIHALSVFPVAVGVVRSLDDLVFNELHTLTGLPQLPRERLTSLERNLPGPPPGLSPEQTARTYSPSRTSKRWSLLPCTTPRRPRARGALHGHLGSRAATPPYPSDEQ